MSKELDYIADLERKNRLLGERCNQLLKDKGELTDKIADIKANCDLAIEGRDIKIRELEQKLEQTEKDLADYQFNYPKIKELEKENAELKKQIEKLKTDLDNAIVSASKWYVEDPVYSMLVDIYNDNFELKEIEK